MYVKLASLPARIYKSSRGALHPSMTSTHDMSEATQREHTKICSPYSTLDDPEFSMLDDSQPEYYVAPVRWLLLVTNIDVYL